MDHPAFIIRCYIVHNRPRHCRDRGSRRPLPRQLSAGPRGLLRLRPRQPAEDVGRPKRDPRHPPVRRRRRQEPLQVMRRDQIKSEVLQHVSELRPLRYTLNCDHYRFIGAKLQINRFPAVSQYPIFSLL